MMKKIFSTEIANFLGKELHGQNTIIYRAKSIHDYQANSVSFLSRGNNQESFKVNGLLIVSNHLKLPDDVETAYITSDNPRLDFAKIVQEFFNDQVFNDLRNHSYISNTAKLAENVIVGSNCYVGENVEIGSNTVLNHNIVISSNTIIGKNCYFKSGSVIGEDGFGFDFDDKRKPIRIPHIGNVIIHDNVEIGANNTVVRATLGETVIGKNSKTDDHVHIAHNCIVGENCIITASAEISGSVKIGNDVWIGPNSSIMNNITLGDYSMVGLGSVVTKSIPNFSLIAGSPAKQLGWVSKKRVKLDLPIESIKIKTIETDNTIYVLEGSELKLKKK